jgi:hypothetical protein
MPEKSNSDMRSVVLSSSVDLSSTVRAIVFSV